MIVIFGEYVLQLPSMQRMEETLTVPTPFRYHGPQEFQGYFWKYHCAIRRSFMPSRDHESRMQPFQDLLFRMRQGMPYSPQEIPLELRGGGNKRPGEIAPPSGSPRGEREKRQRRQGVEVTGVVKPVVEKIIRTIGQKVKEASDAMEAAGKKLSTRTMFPAGLEPAFGAILDVVKATPAGSKSPCPRLFLYGRCTVGNCKASHELSRAPPDAAVKHYTDWVTAKCAQIKANPNA
jgi:hypothetical protein